MKYGVGRHNYYVPPASEIKAQHLLFASEVPWAISMMFIKISIACMLLRVKNTRGWVIFLRCMIGIQIASALASVIFQLLICRPLAAIWDPAKHPNAICMPPQAGFVSIYVNSTIAIATDLIFAVLPITFIWKIHRPLREKLILALLMGLGLFAAVTSIIKTTLVRTYGITGDNLWDSIDISLWSMLEEQTGIIAACIPCLKSPFERLLGRFGLLSTIKRTTYYRSNDETFGAGKSHQLSSLRAGNRLSVTGKHADAQSEESILAANDEDQDLKKTKNWQIVKTTELHFSEETPRRARAKDDDGKVDDADKGFEGNWQAV